MNSNFDTQEMITEFQKGFNEEEKLTKRANVLVCGNTGVGKSSFINKLIGKTVAQVGEGKPVTRGVTDYKVSKNLYIYDSEGYEVDNVGEFYSAVLEKIDVGSSEDKYIHLALFCISVPNSRITDYDIKLIKEISSIKNVPSAIILTQIDITEDEDSLGMQKELRSIFPNINIFEFTTNEPLCTDLKLIEKITAWICSSLSEGQKRAYIKSASTAIAERYSQGEDCILQHTVSGGVVGASPIPFSDAPLLAGNQMVLLGRLANIWEVSLPSAVTGSAFLSNFLSQLGKSLVGNLLKFIPVIGTVTGGVINASVAAALTYAVGTATNGIFRTYAKAKLEGEELPLEDLFLSETFVNTVKILFDEKNK